VIAAALTALGFLLIALNRVLAVDRGRHAGPRMFRRRKPVAQAQPVSRGRHAEKELAHA
jgi:hypothetical protein